MADYSIAQLAAAARAAGFQGTGLINAIAVSLAENGRMLLRAKNTAGNSPPSTDRGPWQINSYWHREVSDACAFDLTCSAQAAYRISSGGASWSPWSTFNNGAYRQHLADAQAAAGASSGPVAASTFGITLPSSNPVGDAISGAVGRTVGSVKGSGSQALSGGQLLLGVLIVLAGGAVLALIFFRESSVGRGTARVGRDVGKASLDVAGAVAALVPK